MITLAVVLTAFLFIGTASAVEGVQETASRILSIDVKGSRFVEKETILAKMAVKSGQVLDRRRLSKDIRTLHQTGFFSDVRFTGSRTDKGIHLVCHVKEYPLIASVKMEGNNEHGFKDLQLRMKLRPGRIFSPRNQQSDRNTLLKGYLKDGFYQVDVQFSATPRKDGRVDVLVTVNEGEITRISRIQFIGNNAFTNETLRGEIASRQISLLAWVSDKDVFDQERFSADTQLLQQYYLNNGYLDMKIESTRLSMSSDKGSFDLTFSIHEGEQYKVSSIDVLGDLVPDQETLQAQVVLKADRTYSLKELRESIDAITNTVGDEGYAFASVTPLLKRNIDDRTVAVSFDVEKGDEVYVERIEITGNKKTEDEVVRRIIKQSEGARYSGSQVAQSKKDLKRAVYVQDARVSLEKASSANKVKMKVVLNEKKTGSFSAGVGYSQTEKVTLQAKITEENLLGKGYQVNLNGEIGSLTQNISTSLTDPYFLGRNISASISAFKTQTDPIATSNYSNESLGGGLGIGIPLTHELSYGIAYKYNRTDLTLSEPTTSPFILSQLGRQTTGEVIQSLSWDSRDRMMAPREGQVHQLSVGVAGLGGSNKFYETSFSSKAYIPFGENKDFVLNPNFSTSYIRGYSNIDIPLYRRFSLGGIGSVRGFDSLGISLRDPVTGEAVGGDKMVSASLNFFFPLPYMTASGFRGLAFVDAGTVWGSVSSTVAGVTLNVVEPFSLSHMRYSAGLGFEWLSPIGPVGLAWAVPIRTVKGDLEKNVEFMLGGSF